MIDDIELDTELKIVLRACLLPATKRPTANKLLDQLRSWFRAHRPK